MPKSKSDNESKDGARSDDPELQGNRQQTDESSAQSRDAQAEQNRMSDTGHPPPAGTAVASPAPGLPQTGTAPAPPPPAGQRPEDTRPTGQASASATAPGTTPLSPEPAPPGQERDYRITLESSTGQRQVVIARGPDGGLAAQHAMRSRPGWTAQHHLTVEADAAPTPFDQAHAERETRMREEADRRAAAVAERETREQEEAARQADEAMRHARGEA